MIHADRLEQMRVALTPIADCEEWPKVKALPIVSPMELMELIMNYQPITYKR